MWHFVKQRLVKNAGRKALRAEKAKKQELHTIIMKRMCLGLLSLQLSITKQEISQVEPLYRLYANLSLSPSLLHSMLQQWQRKGEPLPYAALCSVTSSSGTNPFRGLFVHTPCSGRSFRALVFLPRLRCGCRACAHAGGRARARAHGCAGPAAPLSGFFPYFCLLKRFSMSSYGENGRVFHPKEALDWFPRCQRKIEDLVSLEISIAR